MTIEKAIELLQGYVKPTAFVPHEDIDDAISLGIEALKRVRTNRQPIRAHWKEPLPGETSKIEGEGK